MPLVEKVLLRKRSIIETVFSVLKGSFEIEHTRHRSIWNAFVHILSALVAYCLKPTKPSIKSNLLIRNWGYKQTIKWLGRKFNPKNFDPKLVLFDDPKELGK